MKYEHVLNPYSDTWRCRRDSVRIYCLMGRWGSIQPWNLNGQTLCAVIQAKSQRHLSGILMTIQNLHEIRSSIVTRGDSEAVLTFPNEITALKAIAGPIGLYRRRKYPNRTLSGAVKTKEVVE